MPSPDAAQYIDLTVFDQDAEDIFNAAKAAILAKFPSLVLVEPSIEATLLEAMAVEIADLAVMVNRVPGAVVEVLLLLFGISRNLGIAATASVTFTLADTLGHTIPAHSRVRYDPGGGQAVVDFTTDTDLIIAPGSTTGTVTVTAATYTSAANGISVGTMLSVVTGLTAVNTVSVATSPIGGAGAESDNAYFTRAMQTLGRQVTTLVRPEHFTAAALNEIANGVYRSTTISRSDGTGATVNGHIAVAVCGQGGALLSSGYKASILADLQAMASVELTIHIIDPTITTVAVTVTVTRKSGYAAATVQANIQAALAAFLNPDTWQWGGVVRLYDLIALIEDVAGVDHITTLAAPSADVTLTGVANLASLGIATITVS